MSTAPRPVELEVAAAAAPALEPVAVPMRASTLLSDYAQLFKVRVTSLVVMTAWAGYYFGAHKSFQNALSWGLLHTLVGISLVSAGASAINEVIERRADSRMLRTMHRPLPSGRMSLMHGITAAALVTIVGLAYIGYFLNLLTMWLALATVVSYAFIYTPLKQLSSISTFVGAFPGAMPPLLGWTAARGRLEWEAIALFAILFVWQFPHFLAIAWLYREDYQRAGIVMLPVIDKTGRSTTRQIIYYALLLVPVSLAPAFLRMTGLTYFITAGLLSIGFLGIAVRLASLRLPPSAPESKKFARELLRASVIYLPILLILMAVDGVAR